MLTWLPSERSYVDVIENQNDSGQSPLRDDAGSTPLTSAGFRGCYQNLHLAAVYPIGSIGKSSALPITPVSWS
jgi:hypothetical protein